MSLPRYPEYRDSGVEWLGEVPSAWKVDRLKASITSCKNGIWGDDPKGDESDIDCVRVADFDRLRLVVDRPVPTQRSVTTSERAGRILRRGDLLLEKSGGGEKQPVGQVVLYDRDEPAVCSNFVAKVSLAKGMFPRFWMYQHAAAYSHGVNIVAIKQTSGIQNLDQSQYFEERGVFPSRTEQEQVATFLDRETARIDALIVEQEKLLALLAEKRQATISHAVTRGLDPNVPMKDSGIAWLGEVPAHWAVRPLKHLCSLLKDGTHLPPGRVEVGVPLLSVRNIAGSVFAFRDDDSMIATEDYEDLCRAFVPQHDDVLMAVVGATLGKVAMVPRGMGQFHIQRSLAIFRAAPGLSPEWLFHCIGSEGFQRLLWEHAGFSAQPGIYLGTLRNFPMPVPPLQEQSSTVLALAKDLRIINVLTAEARRMVTVLRERRSTLITAAVTGQVDVRRLVEVEVA